MDGTLRTIAALIVALSLAVGVGWYVTHSGSDHADTKPDNPFCHVAGSDC